jgi:NTF2 fold immunity protein
MSPLALPRHPRFIDFDGRSFTPDELRLLAASPSIVRLDFKDCAVGDEEVRTVCGLPRLQSLWLAGTRVTDAVLPDIARLPKLDWLILDRTVVTGLGFAAFAHHAALSHLSLTDTAVGDEALPLIARIPRLAHVNLTHTRVTREGLLALAEHPTLEVSGDQFPPEVWEELRLAQRKKANRTPAGFAPSAGEAEAARAVLLGFFAAMAEWERTAAQNWSEEDGDESEEEGDDEWGAAQCAAIFAAYCTARERKYGSPDVHSFSIPPEYEDKPIVDTEWLTARKVFFYTRDSMGRQERYLVLKVRTRWLVDRKEALLTGWERVPL